MYKLYDYKLKQKNLKTNILKNLAIHKFRGHNNAVSFTQHDSHNGSLSGEFQRTQHKTIGIMQIIDMKN